MSHSLLNLKEQVPLSRFRQFSMAIEKGELMHRCSPEHLSMGTARFEIRQRQKQTREDGKMRGMKVERSTVGTKKVTSA